MCGVPILSFTTMNWVVEAISEMLTDILQEKNTVVVFRTSSLNSSSPKDMTDKMGWTVIKAEREEISSTLSVAPSTQKRCHKEFIKSLCSTWALVPLHHQYLLYADALTICLGWSSLHTKTRNQVLGQQEIQPWIYFSLRNESMFPACVSPSVWS